MARGSPWEVLNLISGGSDCGQNWRHTLPGKARIALPEFGLCYFFCQTLNDVLAIPSCRRLQRKSGLKDVSCSEALSYAPRCVRAPRGICRWWWKAGIKATISAVGTAGPHKICKRRFLLTHISLESHMCIAVRILEMMWCNDREMTGKY